jgi:hypothetical protein
MAAIPSRATQATVDRLDANPQFATAAVILRTLENGVADIEREIEALRIEDYLPRLPENKREKRKEFERRLKTLRSTTSRKEILGQTCGMPPVVVMALELLTEGKRPSRLNRPAAIARLEEDLTVVNDARREQQRVVDSIRVELNETQAKKDRKAHDALQLAHYRALQTAAATMDAIYAFRKSRIDAGYTWCEGLLPAPTSRAALILGSENESNSGISDMRRILEELKIL